MVQKSLNEQLYIVGDLNGHVRICRNGYENVHVGFGYKILLKESLFWILYSYDLLVANTCLRSFVFKSTPETRGSLR